MLHEALHCSKPVLNINRQEQHSQVLMLGTQHQVSQRWWLRPSTSPGPAPPTRYGPRPRPWSPSPPKATLPPPPRWGASRARCAISSSARRSCSAPERHLCIPADAMDWENRLFEFFKTRSWWSNASSHNWQVLLYSAFKLHKNCKAYF